MEKKEADNTKKDSKVEAKKDDSVNEKQVARADTAAQKPDPRKTEEIKKTYRIEIDNVKATVRIILKPEEYVPIYDVEYPKMQEATSVVIDTIREELIEKVSVSPREILNSKLMEGLKQRFMEKANEL
ncbi:MAG: hypothetical protein HZB68_02250, partial [Candidatus Aenigmarchaeota archaeon]|nr:hypothetical protein [Candidatus Aenigmarchaeota archaeon]